MGTTENSCFVLKNQQKFLTILSTFPKIMALVTFLLARLAATESFYSFECCVGYIFQLHLKPMKTREEIHLISN